ncbi:radical SAM protein, partial [Candidatus Woesearchaeota archaeon]|nr:radical SAM protein [Candidatus Woesearchaeota archaeon]
EFTSFMAQKNEGKYDLWINPHGEPLLYAPIVELVHGLKEHSKVGKVVVITNGMLLTEKLVDDLAQAGLDRFSISFHSPNPENSQKIFGTKAYNVEKVKKMVEYAAKKIKVVLTPVYIQGMNEKEMSDVIDWANALDVTVQIQKFCINKMGRNPIKEQGWETFFEELKKIEKETNTVLIQPLGKLVETGELPKPFKKDETIEVEILCSGRLSRDKIGRASDRAVLVLNCPKEKGKVKVRLIQSKHNIFVGVLK